MSISLASIQTGVAIKPPKVVIYGPGGIGKTTWAAGAPRPIFLFTEEGIGLLDAARFPLLQSWGDIMDALTVLSTEDHSYETVVLDSLDFAEPLLWAHTATKRGKADIEAFGFGKGYTYAVDEARELFQALDYLRNERGMAVILIAHDDTVRVENPETETYDRNDLRLHKRLTAHVDFWSECVLYAHYKTTVVKDNEGFNRERRRAIGRGDRVLSTTARPAWRAKNKFSLPDELPLEWSAFAAAMEHARPDTDTNPNPGDS